MEESHVNGVRRKVCGIGGIPLFLRFSCGEAIWRLFRSGTAFVASAFFSSQTAPHTWNPIIKNMI